MRFWSQGWLPDPKCGCGAFRLQFGLDLLAGDVRHGRGGCGPRAGVR